MTPKDLLKEFLDQLDTASGLLWLHIAIVALALLIYHLFFLGAK